MPSRGSYQIASQDERKAAWRDQSYRSCVATLLIFFMLCMVILIACIPWRKYGTSQYNKKEGGNPVVEYHSGNKPYNEESIEVYTDKTITTETTTDVPTDVFTQNHVSENSRNQSFERYVEVTTTLKEPLVTDTLETTLHTTNTFNNDISSTDSQDQSKTTVKKIETTEQPELRTTDINHTTLSDNYEISESTKQEETSTVLTILTSEVTNTNSYKTETYIETSENSTFSTDSTPTSSSVLVKRNTSEDLYTTTEEQNNTESTTFQTTVFAITNSSEVFSTTDSSLDNNNTEINKSTKEFSTTYEPSFTSTQKTITEFMIGSERSYPIDIETITESNIATCNSGHCKQVAARMLSYMNHSADPCEDFYEYACGGMVADPQIIDLDLTNKAIHRIAKQMQNSNNTAASLFTTYYNSCMQYENTISMNERIALVKEAVNSIGKFYTIHDTVDSYGDFTTMYATLLNYSSLLFDVEPDLDEYNPNEYTIRVGPALHKNLFDSENIDDFCNQKESKTQQQFVDLESIYESYTECKQNNTQFIKSINDALTVLGVFNDTGDIEQNVSIIAINIDTEIVQGFFDQFPPQAKIREAYLMKHYTNVLMEELNKTATFINWDRLLFLLIKNNVNHNEYIQGYFYQELKSGLQNLENFWKREPMNFHNAVLGLYAHKLYQDLVVSKHKDVEQHCLRVSTNLLGPEASSLYMSSLSDEEITNMRRTVTTFFNELKHTLAKKIEMEDAMTKGYRQRLLGKISDLSLSIPEMSYFQYEKNNELCLSNNYINNSLILMKRYRFSIYSVIPSAIHPGTPKQIWTRYATPFQSKGVAVYGLNLVIIPFGAIDYGGMFIENDDALSNYLIWATIGNIIARQISHHFDGNGMSYWNRTRHDSHFNQNNQFRTYINCHGNNIYTEQFNMTLPLTSQTISFKVSEHTLNARLSEIMGLRLTYDTLEKLQLFSKNQLPWLQLNVKQLFYLTYAQMYCTKSLLTTSYVSLHENEDLPSRIRVLVSASSDRILGESWDCPQGSQIVPSSRCDVFPHLELDLETLSS